MAMSRSMGASSLILCSSIWISPDEISSSPATMRSVVVLPQPEGPTSTTNSRSRISRFTSLTACTSSYFLLRFFSRTRAMSALHAAGHSGDIVLDEERIDDGDRNRADQRADRKSTRLNSSHGYISYAVFCLKKKKNQYHALAVMMRDI